MDWEEDDRQRKPPRKIEDDVSSDDNLSINEETQLKASAKDDAEMRKSDENIKGDKADANEQKKTVDDKDSEHEVEIVTKKHNITYKAVEAKPSSQTNGRKSASTEKNPNQRMPLQRARANGNELHSAPRYDNRKQKSQSARYPSRGYMTSQGSTSSRSTSGKSVISRPRTTLGFASDQKKKERDFFHAELKRLKDSLRSESKKISKPKVRDHYPDVFTSLEPYYNTYTANYLINMPDLGYKEKQPRDCASRESEDAQPDLMFTTRKTAIGLCDPEKSLHMDREVLPKLETAEIRRRRMEHMHHMGDNKPKSAGAKLEHKDTTPRDKKPEAKQGSTRLPKFPVIQPPNSDLTTKELVYSDVPMLRFDEYGAKSKPHMRAAYFAYLQNTPGSRKAIYDCMKEMSSKKKKEEQPPQAVA
ncbi:hypothetical protein MAR_032693 [Mya arenaria]|uniref:Uncharacterized protein n=1 Tax=Mya arenaria TaxID=6604 RepID=A0ABY7FAD7_MYAAR|nr:hypothetical protein MAR_032693 [Mya arenaria]